MFSKTICMTLAATMLSCAPAMADGKPKSADELIGKYVKAIGGRKAIDAVKSVRFIGKTMIGSIEAPMTIEMARPNKIRTEIDFQGTKLVTAFDGVMGWFISPSAGSSSAERMTNEQLDAALNQADFDGPLIDYKKKGHKVELAEDGMIDGSPTLRLKMTRKDGAVEYFHFDPEYFIVVARTKRVAFDGGTIEEARHFGDYKPVAGRLFAHSVENKRGGMTQGLISFQKIEVNPKLSSDRFSMPRTAAGGFSDERDE